MPNKALTDAEQHWEAVFSEGIRGDYGRVRYPGDDDPVLPGLNAALAHFGDVRGKTVLDVGCGNGGTSLFFAREGANVIATDISQAAIDNLKAFCDEHGIPDVTPVRIPAQEISSLGPVDFVFGSMILHHIEPFQEFAATLRGLLPAGGRAFFFENNARSELMIWFRENVVGRYGIPKFGDDEEFPLTPAEVGMLRRHFQVEQVYPTLHFFQMIPQYLLRGKLEAPFLALDRFFYRFPRVRQYSYRQFVYLS
ncbi:MAG: class I SAM-dependent methyltransferase [Gemmatimonadota bacterium]|nr:class I SAM-dependent methyltransferase [Gemmatimonadota bacterium]